MHESPFSVKLNTIPALVTESTIPQLRKVRMKLNVEGSANREKNRQIQIRN